MKLTENFTLNEFVVSQTALSNRIGNMPNDKQIEALRYLVENLLQPLREALDMPINVNSGFRSKALNTTIGGSATSQHMKGEAADITCPDNTRMFSHIRDNFEFDQLIWEMGDDFEPEWVHVSLTRGKNRNQVLRAYRKPNGDTRYETF